MNFDKLQKENKELRDALNFKDQYDEYDFIGCSIIAKDRQLVQCFTINRGSKDDIEPDFLL